MTLKIKNKKLFWQNCILDNFILWENLSYRGLLSIKDPGDPKRPDPTVFSVNTDREICKTFKSFEVILKKANTIFNNQTR